MLLAAPFTRLAAIAAIAAVAACTQPPASASQAVSLRECTVNGVAGPARCGTVRVSESAADPSGRQIDIAVIVLPAYSATPAADPILPLVGGPGQGSAELAAAQAQRFESFRAERDLLLIDQRGTGASNGLQCDAAASASELMGAIFDLARMTVCRDQLAARADLTRYTTALAAADYERVFDVLGYRQVNVFGGSYGTRMGLELARRFPDRVRSLTIEGVVPFSFDWPTSGAADAEAALNAVIDDCAADANCARTFGRFRQDIELAFTRVARGPVTVSVRDTATGRIEQVPFGVTDLAYATRGILYGNDALSLPLWFRRAAEGDFDAFAQAYVTRARALETQIAHGVHLGVYCAEDLPFVDWAQAERLAAGTRIAGYLLDQYRRACEMWPRGQLPTGFREPVQSNVPTLLMAGRRDPVTPPRTAEAVARTLPRSRVLVWQHGGHGTDGLTSRECRNSIQREFLRSADPERLPIECMTRSSVLPFRLGQ